MTFIRPMKLKSSAHTPAMRVCDCEPSYECSATVVMLNAKLDRSSQFHTLEK